MHNVEFLKNAGFDLPGLDAKKYDQGFTAIADLVKKNFQPVMGYDVRQYVSRPLRGDYVAYTLPEQTIGGLLISDQNDPKVVALVNFRTNKQAVFEANPDGLGDRIIIEELRDRKLDGLRSFVVAT